MNWSGLPLIVRTPTATLRSANYTESSFFDGFCSEGYQDTDDTLPTALVVVRRASIARQAIADRRTWAWTCEMGLIRFIFVVLKSACSVNDRRYRRRLLAAYLDVGGWKSVPASRPPALR